MNDFHYYNERVKKSLDRLDTLIVQLSSKSESQHKLIQECDAELRRLDGDLEASENAIQTLDKGPDKSSAEREFMQAKERLNKAKTEVEFRRSKGQSHALFGAQADEDAKPKKLGDMSAQQVIERGDNLYNEAENRLANALGITEASKQVVGNIEVELKQQEDQIDRIQDKTEDIRSNLKRANKIMDLIYRRYLTDKCIAVLIILIIIILIIIIGFGIAKSGKLSFATDSIH